MAQAQTQIRSDLQTVGEVLTADYTYQVPIHQRDFSWTTDEVKQLWDDIMDAMQENRPEYFLGTMVVTEDRDARVRSVIDGQQRLATLTMILAGIRSIYADQGDDRQEEVYKDYLGVRDRRTRLTEPRLALNTTNEGIFHDFVIEHVSLGDLGSAKRRLHPSPSNALLSDAARFIREAIAERVAASFWNSKSSFETASFSFW